LKSAYFAIWSDDTNICECAVILSASKPCGDDAFRPRALVKLNAATNLPANVNAKSVSSHCEGDVSGEDEWYQQLYLISDDSASCYKP
jgi:hypothetical protein